MIYLVVGLLGLAAIFAINVGAVLAGRWACAQLLGLPERPFWPFPASRSGPPIVAYKRALLVVAGFAAAYCLAAGIHAGGLLVNGVGVDDPRELSSVVDPVPGKAAALAGARSGDRILTVAEEPIHSWEELKSALSRHGGQTVDVGIQRGAERLTLAIPVSPEGRVGVTPTPEMRPVGVVKALTTGFSIPYQIFRALERSLFADRSELSGPVGIVAESAAAGRRADQLSPLATFNSMYGLVFALVFSVALGLRGGSAQTKPAMPE